MALQVLVGADPEIFMFDNAGKPVSAHGAIKGDKKNPFKVEHGAVQVDGMALEFNIDPAANKEEFSRNIQAVLATLTSMVPGYTLKSCPVAEFGEDYIKAQPMEALELGCEPDFDAYTGGGVNPRPNGQVPFRTAAGHVHIGWGNGIPTDDPIHLEACVMASKQLDFSLGLGSLLFDSGEAGRKRRQLYGAPGCFRPKSYGVEYRTLSNAWLQSKALMEWVFEVTQQSMSDLSEGIRYGEHDTTARTIINGAYGNDIIQQYFKRTGCPLPPGYNERTRTFKLA